MFNINLFLQLTLLILIISKINALIKHINLFIWKFFACLKHLAKITSVAYFTPHVVLTEHLDLHVGLWFIFYSILVSCWMTIFILSRIAHFIIFIRRISSCNLFISINCHHFQRSLNFNIFWLFSFTKTRLIHIFKIIILNSIHV